MSDDAETNPDLHDWNAVPPLSTSHQKRKRLGKFHQGQTLRVHPW